MLPSTIPVTFFTDARAQFRDEQELSPKALAERIREMVATEKARLPWLKLARFGDRRSDKRSLRHDGNVEKISGVELDYDGGRLGFDHAVRVLKSANLAAIVYTSPSHTPDAPRWRILAPTSRDLPPEERYRLCARINGLFGGIFADESFTLSQSYYYGKVYGAQDFRVTGLNGFTIDELDSLDAGAIGRRGGAYTNGHDYGSPNVVPFTSGHDKASGGDAKPNFDIGRSRFDPEVCIRNIKAGREMHNNARDLAARMVATGRQDWEIAALLEALLTPVSDGGTLGQIPEFIRSARTKWGIPAPEEDWDSYAARNGGLPLEWFGDIQPSLNTSDFVEGLLCDTAMSVVYGESNCGKTFFMTDLAFHIAMGRSWRGREVEQGGVIYVALEGGFGIRNRLAALRIHYAIGTAKVPFGIVPCSINMLDANADTGPLIELVNEAAKSIDMPIKLVVIDTLARAMNGGNENAPEDMGKLVKSADRIREQTGAHIAFVHHSGKDQARGARGHSSLRAATDTEIEITRDEDASYSIATVTKQRELEIEGEFAFSLEQVPLGTNKRGKPVTSCVVVEAEAFDGAKKRTKLTDHEFSFMVEIRELMNREGPAEYVSPELGMPVLKTLKRDILRDRLISRGKLAVTDAVTGLSNAERQRLFRVLNALRDKGFIEMNATRIWVLE